MKKWLRRARGAVGMGLTWAAAWFGAGMVLLAILGPDAADVPFPLGFGLLGFLAGVTFSGALFALAGAGSAAGSPAVARWGERRDPLEAGAGVDGLGRPGARARRLPGGGR